MRQRRALGALFFVLAIFFVGISFTAFAADERGVWVVGAAAGAIAVWMLGLSARALRPRRR